MQRVADRLSSRESGAAQKLLNAYLAYMDVHGQPDRKHESACAAALEYWYLCTVDKNAELDEIAFQYGVSERLMRIYVQRFNACMQAHKQSQQGE